MYNRLNVLILKQKLNTRYHNIYSMSAVQILIHMHVFVSLKTNSQLGQLIST